MPDSSVGNLPFVLLHGLFGSFNDRRLLDAFAPHHVLAPGLLGYGAECGALLKDLSIDRQADHVARALDVLCIGRARVIGHSVGGAVAVRFAHRYPDRVAALVSVEGNMTPPDAFWSAQLARKSAREIDEIVAGYRADVGGWIAGAGVEPTARALRVASAWLDNQPSATLKAQARAVVEVTKAESYLGDLRSLLADGLELHLVAGARSQEDWHVPTDIEAAARSRTLLSERGHLMMLEAPQEFGEAIVRLFEEPSSNGDRDNVK